MSQMSQQKDKLSKIRLLVNSLNNYTTTLENKNKLNQMVNEIESRSVLNFKNILKISNNKYKSIKSGTHMNQSLNNEVVNKEQIIQKVIDDMVFVKSDYNLEKYKLVNNYLHKKIPKKELFQMREMIRGSPSIKKNLNLQSLNVDNRLFELKEKFKMMNLKSSKNQKKTGNKVNMNPKVEKESKNENKKTRAYSNDENISIKEISIPKNQISNELLNEIKHEENTFLTSFKDYRQSLKHLGNSLQEVKSRMKHEKIESEGNEEEEFKKDNFSEKTHKTQKTSKTSKRTIGKEVILDKDLLIWKYKYDKNILLSYKPNQKNFNHVEDSGTHTINLNKLIHSSLRKNKFDNDNKKNEDRKIDSNENNEKNKKDNYRTTNNHPKSKSQFVKTFSDENENYTDVRSQSNHRSNDNNKITNMYQLYHKYQNSIMTLNALNEKEKIELAQLSENLKNENNLNLIKNKNSLVSKYDTIQLVRGLVVRSLEENLLMMDKRRKIEELVAPKDIILKPDEIEKKVARKNILKQNKYLSKKKEKQGNKSSKRRGSTAEMADQSQNLNDEILEKEKANSEEVNIFQLKNKREPQLYSDEYANRDKFLNIKIKELTNILGPNVYDKKKLNFKVDEFLHHVNDDFNEIVKKRNYLPPINKKFHKCSFVKKHWKEPVKETNSFNTMQTGSITKNSLYLKERVSKWNLYEHLIDDFSKYSFEFGVEHNSNLIPQSNLNKSENDKMIYDSFKNFEREVLKKELDRLKDENKTIDTHSDNNYLSDYKILNKDAHMISEKEEFIINSLK